MPDRGSGRDTGRDIAGAVAARGAIGAATTVADACQAAVGALPREGGPEIEVLLRGEDTLHCFAVAGSWRVCYYAVPAAGAIRAALDTGEPAVDDPVDPAGSPYPVASRTRVVLCVPVPGPEGTPVGVIKIDLPDRTRLDALRGMSEPIVAALGARLVDLGYRERESPSERLLRYALGIAVGTDTTEFIKRGLHAARDVSGMDTAVIIRKSLGEQAVLLTEPGHDTTLLRRLQRLRTADMADIVATTRRYGAWFTSGSPEQARVTVPGSLLDIGARSVIAVPAGYGLLPEEFPTERVLLIVDEQLRRPPLTAIGELRLLSAHAQMSYERMMLVRSLRAMAERDPLTGLGHQATLSERMTRTVAGRTALAVIDVDNFKEINDTRGHAAGDQVLIDLADVLGKVLRPGDGLYRIGGDEFVAVLEVDSIERAERIGQRLVNAAHQVGCTISVGLSMQAEGENSRDVLRRADEAMYRAKREGRGRLSVAGQDR